MKHGFSLIELMVVIAIIAILAAIALPLYSEFSCKTRANEPLNALKDGKSSFCVAHIRHGGYDRALWGDRIEIMNSSNITLPETARWTYVGAATEDDLTITVTDAGNNPPCLSGFNFAFHIQSNSDGCRFQISTSSNTDYIKATDIQNRF